MRGNICKEPTDAVEQAKRLHAEACELRLARIQNGAHPEYKNGTEYPKKERKTATS